MTGHTPGPWLADGSVVYALDGERYGMRVVVATHGWADKHSCVPDERTRKDVALMAAAPELLDALETIINGHLLDPRDGDRMDRAAAAAERAINKARGESE